MSRIRIRNFGPIKEGLIENDGWIDIKKVTLFIGNQGSGKSTVAKLISIFSWIEKDLTKEVHDIKHFENSKRFRKNYCGYHRIENYFSDMDGIDRTEIDYQGESFHINYHPKKLEITPVTNRKYLLPQIMYVPAERNFISSVKITKFLSLFPGSLIEFMAEFDNAKNAIKGGLQIPINEATFEYDKLNDIVNIKGTDYKVRLSETSSGFQSAVPLFIVSRYLATTIKEKSDENSVSMSIDELKRFKHEIQVIFDNKSFTEEQKRAAFSVLASKINKAAFFNIVEEPEQNLYPDSQKDILYSLLEYANMNKGNKLIMTTHSPFIINYLTLAIKAAQIKVKNPGNDLINSLERIVPMKSFVDIDDVIIYEMDDKNGGLKILKNYQGLPNDDNYLNQKLAENNDLFSELLEIETNAYRIFH